MKHLLLEIAEATEAAAIAASKYVGSGDKLQIDKVATEAMRKRLDQIDMKAQVVIGEGIKDGSYGLFKGERIGLRSTFRSYSGEPTPEMLRNLDDPRWQYTELDYDIAVDPVDGTTQTAKGGYEAMSVIAVGGYKCLLSTDNFYMKKIALGQVLAKEIKSVCGKAPKLLQKPMDQIVGLVQKILKKKQVTACILDRPRHDKLAVQLRACGCRIKFIQDCDVSGAIAAALPESGIDLFVGVGGAPEGVIAAAAMKCLGGYFECCLVDDKTYEPLDDKVLLAEQLANGNVLFAATGITEGSLLKGIRHESGGVITQSIIMESSTKSFKRVRSYYEL